MPDTPGHIEMAVVSKKALREALVASGLSYEQPPEHDVDKLWEELRRDAQIVLVQVTPEEEAGET